MLTPVTSLERIIRVRYTVMQVPAKRVTSGGNVEKMAVISKEEENAVTPY